MGVIHQFLHQHGVVMAAFAVVTFFIFVAKFDDRRTRPERPYKRRNPWFHF